MSRSTGKGPYDLAPGERGVDNTTYNPQSDARSDNAAFDPNADNYDDFHPIGARGAGNQPSNVDFEQEDLETEGSEKTGQVPRRKLTIKLSIWCDLSRKWYAGEVEDLFGSTTSEERNTQGRTRGVKNDAYKQERKLDQSFLDTGIADAEQDVDITSAAGRGDDRRIRMT